MRRAISRLVFILFLFSVGCGQGEYDKRLKQSISNTKKAPPAATANGDAGDDPGSDDDEEALIDGEGEEEEEADIAEE